MSSDIPISKPPIFKILDDDIIHVVTGYNKPGAHLASRDASMYNIKKYILDTGNIIAGNRILTEEINDYGVRIHTTGINANEGNNIEISFSQARNTGNGPPYYSATISTTGLNARAENLIVRDLETIWPYSGVIYNTGLNAIVGNNLEIQFSVTGDAAIKYGGAGGKYLSGIISTTGLNARTENLIVRDFETSWPYSGTIYNTGLNAIVGNNIEIQFSSGTAASNKYGGTAGKYKSGIISTTGLNARTENLIVRDFETSWPHSGIIYTTGLNSVAGNNIEIQFSTSSDAHSAHGGAGGKYYSGIISTTGLNTILGDGIGHVVANSWPHKYTLFNLEKTKKGSSNITIVHTGNGFSSSSSNIYNLLNLSYNDLYYSKSNQTYNLLGTVAFRISNIIFDSPPYVPPQGSINDRKMQELMALNGISYNYNYFVCPHGNNPDLASAIVTFGTGDFPNFYETNSVYISDTFTLTIGISGGGSNGFISNLHTVPIIFKNRNGPNANNCSEIYRSGNSNYLFNGINAIDPIIIQETVALTIDSSGITQLNSLALCATISNVGYSRTYQYVLGISDLCNGNILTDYYSYTTQNTYTSAQATIYPLFIKGENIIA